ncbi:MAG: glycerol-3-phosphate 1-O-acyltransferase PlsY [Bacteroidales bacterium]|jgi:glycerol-3-phosphate acyltransferase PlsY|nr:glycerol-3-phosphate 1-O-acyltransferase PlsY [Bacteroidales bacterium]
MTITITIPVVLALIIGGLVAYLLGSIPSAVWIGKSFYGIDVREKGSKNAGATNTIRVLGLLPGIFVLCIDAFKGWFAIYLSRIFGVELIGTDYMIFYQLLIGILCVIGHALPIFAGFKGGKGVATMLGIVIGLFIKIIPLVLAVFIVVFILSHYVSLSSMSAAVSFPIFYVGRSLFMHEKIDIVQLIFAILVAIFIIWTHRKNIKRLINKEEPKFKFKKTEE